MHKWRRVPTCCHCLGADIRQACLTCPLTHLDSDEDLEIQISAVACLQVRQSLGPTTDIEAGTKALLAQEGVVEEDFSLEVGGPALECCVCHSAAGCQLL